MRGIVGLIVLAACAHNVPQDKATSEDGRIKGAKKLVLEEGAVSDHGIVTYPGGDRIDWKMIELPEKLHGPLAIKLTWTTPRPGLKLAFDVFDKYNAQVATSKKIAKQQREASIADARGTYFIRVYAVGRGDAGRYSLGVEFDGREDIPWDPRKLAVNDPPTLMDVPPISQSTACDLVKFDFSNPDCHDKCPIVNPPATWPGCQKTCTVVPPNPDIPACATTMRCPKGGDIRVPSCTEADFPPCPDPKHPDMNNLRCVNWKWPDVATRIGKKLVVGNEVEITIMAGSNSGIETGWTAVVLQGDTNKPLPNGTIRIKSIDQNVIVGRVSLTAQQVEQNLRVLVSPPPKVKVRAGQPR